MNNIRIVAANEQHTAPAPGTTILADGITCSFNDYMSGVNDNILVVGGSGTGKTRTVVRPNILQATGSYIICDPKGNLHNQYAQYLKQRGYRVERLDFAVPEKSTVHYNMFSYISSQKDMLTVAHMLNGDSQNAKDPFWDRSAEILYMSLICYMIEAFPTSERSIVQFARLLQKASRVENKSELDDIMKRHEARNAESTAVRFYRSVSMNPNNTWNCIVSTALSKFANYATKELNDLMSSDTIRMDRIGKEPTALFVVISDTDRSMDTLANIFYSQAMQELCRVADKREDSRLKVPVRFILDDFATNAHIDEFPRIISSIRSRGISAMLMVQSEAQLESGYNKDCKTIISNCDTYIYLGGNDIETARAVGERCDRPMLEILTMPVGTCWVFRRGQMARNARTFDLEPFESAQIKDAVDNAREAARHDRERCDERLSVSHSAATSEFVASRREHPAATIRRRVV